MSPKSSAADAAYADQRRVVQPVVAAFEFDDLVAAGCGARQADRVHGRFRSAIAEAAHLDRKAGADFFRQFPLHVVGHAVHRALVESGLRRP